MVVVRQHAIQHWLSIFKQLCHCLEERNAHDAEKAQLHKTVILRQDLRAKEPRGCLAHTTWQLVPDVVANMYTYTAYILRIYIACRQQPQAARLLQSVLFTAVRQYTAAVFAKADSNAIAACAKA